MQCFVCCISLNTYERRYSAANCHKKTLIALIIIIKRTLAVCTANQVGCNAIKLIMEINFCCNNALDVQLGRAPSITQQQYLAWRFQL